MYAVIRTVKHGPKEYKYVQLVESRRVNGEPRQFMIESLGRIEGKSPEELRAIADALHRFVLKQAGKAADAAPSGTIGAGTGKILGSVAAVAGMWKALGLDGLFERLSSDRKFGFSLERAVFAMVAQRLIEPASKLACVDWLKEDVHLPSAAGLDDDDLYASLSWLEQVKPLVDERLFDRLRRDGRCEPTAFFYDTTATWFEGRGPEELAEYGRPKGGQPRDRRIILVGLVRTREGWPITHKVFPGNRADVSTVIEMIDDLKLRFGVSRFVFVGDRGMVSEKVIEHIQRLGLDYVLAMKLRSNKEVNEDVLGRAGRFRSVSDRLEVKEVGVDGRRYVVCRNPESVQRDRKRREDILKKLEEKIGDGVSSRSKAGAEIRANKAYSRYLRIDEDRLTIDEAKVAEDVRYDGKWVLRSNLADVDAPALAATYKQLGSIERDFREIKSFIGLRPVHHRTEPRVRAHVFVCVLARVIMCELERRIALANEARPNDKATKLTAERALKMLGRVHSIPIRVGESTHCVVSDLNDETRAVLEALQVPESSLRAALRV